MTLDEVKAAVIKLKYDLVFEQRCYEQRCLELKQRLRSVQDECPPQD